MGKKSAYSGISAKDAATNSIDRFIQKNAKRSAHQERLPARRKATDVPVYMWPLRDQIEYYETQSAESKFDEAYPTYSGWYAQVSKLSGVYHTTFIDYTNPLKEVMAELYESMVPPKMAVMELRKYGVY
jgi:hypothetical protein